MAVTVKVDIDATAIERSRITPELKTYANARFYAHMYDYVPMRDGFLSANVQISEECVHFLSPYAARMYTGERYNFRTDKHALATAYWDRAAISAKGDRLTNDIEQAALHGSATMQQAIRMTTAEIRQRLVDAERRRDHESE